MRRRREACNVFGKALEHSKGPEFGEETKTLGDAPLILVADGDGTHRAHVIGLLERIDCRTAETGDGRAALEIADREQPAVVLLDVNLPELNGYEVCRELRQRFGDAISILFVSGDRTEAYDRVAGLLLGADDYIVKPFDDGELLARIRSHLRHLEAVPRVARNGSDSNIALLTAREREVLELLARGLTQGDIATKLVISPKTVGTHIQRILGKLGVHNRAQAVALAHDGGLVDAVALIDVQRHVLT